MAASRRPLVALVALATTLAACDALLGLGSYAKVDCAFDCGIDSGAEGSAIGEGGPWDVIGPADVAEVGSPEGSPEASDDASDAGDGEAATGDGGWDGPTLLERWAQWPMPNPDAATGPDASTRLPNPMAYEAGADGGASTVRDTVTGLVWERAESAQSSYALAAGHCDALTPAGWHVPSRIQLVSLIDFTQLSPTIDPVTFPLTTPGRYWTSSPVASGAADGGGSSFYWTIDFGNGLVEISSSAQYVRCVYEP